MSYLRSPVLQNQAAFSNWLRRLAAYKQGLAAPDPRDQELQDRGTELRWRARVARRSLSR